MGRKLRSKKKKERDRGKLSDQCDLNSASIACGKPSDHGSSSASIATSSVDSGTSSHYHEELNTSKMRNKLEDVPVGIDTEKLNASKVCNELEDVPVGIDTEKSNASNVRNELQGVLPFGIDTTHLCCPENRFEQSQPVICNSLQSLPNCHPITTFSTESASKDVNVPKENLVYNSTLIEILVHLLCRERERDPLNREHLFKAICNVIKLWNNSLYLPQYASPNRQEVRSGQLRKFEILFESIQMKITKTKKQPKIVLPSFQASLGSPLTQLAVTSDAYPALFQDRYSYEYVEKKVLGGGGFGVVVEARNKLDQRNYAIKIIIMKKEDREGSTKLLREVQALAQLNHPNIVRYHNTWLQFLVPNLHHWPESRRRNSFDKRRSRRKRKTNKYHSNTQNEIQPIHSATTADFHEESSGGIVFADASDQLSSISEDECSYYNITNYSEESSGGVLFQKSSSQFESNVNRITKHHNFQSKLFQNSLNLSSHSEESVNKVSLHRERITTDNMSNFEFSNESEMNSIKGPKNFEKCINKKDLKVKINSQVDSVLRDNLSSAVSSDTSSLKENSSDKSLVLFGEQNRKAHMALFIQMGLCGETLSQWITRRNSDLSGLVNRDVCLDIFSQILLAVQYIHSKNIIHRDIKPSNIFFTEDGRSIQLGDFGLARFHDGHVFEEEIEDLTCLTPLTAHTSVNTGGVGTPVYAAPELKNNKGLYGFPSDLHNLGIILLELFHPFSTDSERAFVISGLKENRYLAPKFVNQWSDIAHWIFKLTDHEPTERPTASELLQSSLYNKVDNESVEIFHANISKTEHRSFSHFEHQQQHRQIINLHREEFLVNTNNNPEKKEKNSEKKAKTSEESYEQATFSQLQSEFDVLQEHNALLVTENKNKDDLILKLRIEKEKLQKLLDELQNKKCLCNKENQMNCKLENS